MSANKAYHSLTPKLRLLSRGIKRSLTDSVLAQVSKQDERDRLRLVRARWERDSGLSQSSTSR